MTPREEALALQWQAAEQVLREVLADASKGGALAAHCAQRCSDHLFEARAWLERALAEQQNAPRIVRATQ